MRRSRRLWALLAAGVAIAAALIVIASVNADQASIVGKWSGQLAAPPGSHQARQHFTFVVYKGERRGTWRVGPRCSGTLRLKDISNGYHHYYRLTSKNPGCVAHGIDCFKRAGAKMLDVFVPTSGKAQIAGQFRRIS
jgi:hypothetical protein